MVLKGNFSSHILYSGVSLTSLTARIRAPPWKWATTRMGGASIGCATRSDYNTAGRESRPGRPTWGDGPLMTLPNAKYKIIEHYDVVSPYFYKLRANICITAIGSAAMNPRNRRNGN